MTLPNVLAQTRVGEEEVERFHGSYGYVEVRTAMRAA